VPCQGELSRASVLRWPTAAPETHTRSRRRRGSSVEIGRPTGLTDQSCHRARARSLGPAVSAGGCRPPAVTYGAGGLADGSGGLEGGGGWLVAEGAAEPACLGAVEHDRQGLFVLEGAEPEQRGRSGGAYVRAVLVGVDDERRAELRGERGEGASCLRALLERARGVAEEDVDPAVAGDALQ